MSTRFYRTGDVINGFTLLRVHTNGGNGKHKMWLVLCPSCGIEHVKSSNDISRRKGCYCSVQPRSDRNLAICLDGYNHLKLRHKKYEGSLIDFELFKFLSESNCVYCNSKPSNKAKDNYSDTVWLYTGIDRINSDLGYVTGNVQPCCIKCNFAKSSYTEQEFLAHIKQIYQHSIRGKDRE